MGGKYRFMSGLLATGIMALGCGGSNGGGATTTGADIIIGAPLSVTGTQSKEGTLTKQGYDMWLTWINGQGGINVKGTKHKVHVKYEDDQSKPDISAQLAQKLISEEKAQFLLGPYGSATTASDAVVAENARRSPEEPALYLLYDQVYWMLTFGGLSHVVPPVLRPDVAPYTILVDGISKVFAATGLRVGWVCPPANLSAQFNAFLASNFPAVAGPTCQMRMKCAISSPLRAESKKAGDSDIKWENTSRLRSATMRSPMVITR